MNVRSLLLSCGLTASFLLGVQTPAYAQATRTWVSGVGDDANPCSRTAPCKTWAGAISKTATGGEIDVLDPGGFGGVTITKSITIDGGGFVASGLVSAGANGVSVNAGTTGKVILRNLQIVSAFSPPGARGVQIVAANSVTLQNVDIVGFSSCGVCVASTAPTKVIIENSRIRDNGGDGVLIGQASGVGNRTFVHDSTVSGNGGAGIKVGPASGSSWAYGYLYDNLISFNQDGVLGDGASSSTRISNNDITANSTGLRTLNSGKIYSFQNNRVSGNATDGVPTSTLAAK